MLICSALPLLGMGKLLEISVSSTRSGGSAFPYPSDFRLTFRGRTAIAEGSRALGLKDGDEILFPSYNCGMEFDTLKWHKYKSIVYRIRENLQMDLQDILLKITPETRAIYIIHYFGWEQNASEVIEHCRSRG